MATENTVRMERFAYDVFVDSMKRFRVKTYLSRVNFSENIYEHPDFLPVLSRGYITHQLRKRDAWKSKFEVEFKSNGLKKFKQVSELLEKVLEEIDREPKAPMDRIITSLAVTNELILFLFSKNCKLFLNDLAKLWRNYFAGFEKDFEKAGGLSHLYSIHSGSQQVFDKILDDFIPKYAPKYGLFKISVIFNQIYLDPESYYTLEKVNHYMANMFYSSLEEEISAASLMRSADQESDSLENPGLGIPQHEELLRDSYAPSVYAGTSPEKLNASPTEEASANTNAGSPIYPEGQSKKRGGPTGSPFSPEGPLKNQGALPKSPLSPEEQSKGGEASTGSPLSSQEQKQRRGSPRTPEGTSRIEQKRQKLRQLKKNYPEGQLKERYSPTGSLSPEGQSKYPRALTGSPLSPEGQLKYPSSLTGSSLSPEGQLKYPSSLTGSPLSPEGQLKKRSSPTVSPLAAKGQPKERSSPTVSPLAAKGQSKERGSPTVSPLAAKGQSKERNGTIGSPPTPEGQSKERDGPAGSPFSPEGPLMDQGATPKSPHSPEGQSN